MGKTSDLPDSKSDLECAGAKWAIFGKQNWRCGMNRKPGRGAQVDAHQNPGKVSVDPDSRTVAIKVGTRQGVCNNSPAESTGPENGWR